MSGEPVQRRTRNAWGRQRGIRRGEIPHGRTRNAWGRPIVTESDGIESRAAEDSTPHLEIGTTSAEHARAVAEAFPLMGMTPDNARCSWLTIVCPHHPNDAPVFVVGYIVVNGAEAYPLALPGPASFVQDVRHDDYALDRLAQAIRESGANPVRSADPEEGRAGHTRWVLRCTRPSCSSDVKIGERQQQRLAAVAEAMWARGIGEFTTSDPGALAAGKPPERT